MTGELQLIDTNVLVHAYTVSDERKHEAALSLVERIWEGEAAATTPKNLWSYFLSSLERSESPCPRVPRQRSSREYWRRRSGL